MFLRDEVAMNYIARVILLTFPWLGIALGTWGFVWEALMLISVFLIGLRKGLPLAIILLFIGYISPLVVLGITASNQMSLVPLAGLLGVLGWQKRWPMRIAFFWSAALAAILGAIPTFPLVAQGFDAKTVSDMINMTVQQYQASGLLAVIQQQGFTEMEVRDLLRQGFNLYALILPSFAAIIALVEYGFVFYFARRWFINDKERIPFTRWRLPWYAVWGAVLGIAFYLLGDQFSWAILRGLGINLMVVYGALTLVLGISVFVYLLQSPRIPRFLKVVLIITSFIYLFLSIVSLIMFGLFDLVFNFRRLPEEA